MQRRIEIEGNIHQVAESSDGSVEVVGHPELMVEQLSNHYIEVFRDGESLVRFSDEHVTWVPVPKGVGADSV